MMMQRPQKRCSAVPNDDVAAAPEETFFWQPHKVMMRQFQEAFSPGNPKKMFLWPDLEIHLSGDPALMWRRFRELWQSKANSAVAIPKVFWAIPSDCICSDPVNFLPRDPALRRTLVMKMLR